MALMFDHICLNCGVSFKSLNRKAKYCSRNCFTSHRIGRWINPKRQPREKRKCRICGISFECRIGSTKSYCSHECYWKDSSKFDQIKKVKYGEQGHTTYEKRLCLICKKSFEVLPSSNQKFCSRNCYLIDHSKGMEIVTCKTCHKVFRASSSQHARFCSRDCYLADHSMEVEIHHCPVCGKMFEQSFRLSEKQTFCSQHCANVFNTKSSSRNWKIGKTLRKRYRTGAKVAWSKGLTSESDERIRQMSIKILESYQFGFRSPYNKGMGGPNPYCDAWADKEYKKSILERDGYQCQNPDCWHTTDHLPLCPHHIDYDKRNCNPKNLITACVSCNSRANSNREYWQDFYAGIMNGKN